MKKIMKSAVALLLACLLLIPGGFVFAAEPVSFTDVEADDWFAPYVDYCSANGLVNGMTATTFKPNDGLTRAMFVTILYRFAEVESTEGATMPFTDVPEVHWGRDAILWAYENEVVNGMTPTTFAPDKEITREQMCTILCRFADAMGYEMPSPEEADLFLDDYDISEYAYEYVYTCAAAGVVNGINEYEFAPGQTATRAQACAILMRFVRYTTTTVTQTEAEGGKTVYAYEDKYGVYAEEEITVNGNGDPVERVYSDGVYRESEIWNYNEDGDLTEYKYTDTEGFEITETYAYNENGDITEHKFIGFDGTEYTETYTYNEKGDIIEYLGTYSDGSSDRIVYEYNGDGLISSLTRTMDDIVSTAEFHYVEGTEIIGIYAVTDSYGNTTTVLQGYSEEGYLNFVQFASGEEDAQEYYAFKYTEDGALSYLMIKDPEMRLESVDGSFVDGLPTELTATDADGSYSITIDWEKGTAQITDGDVTETDESGMVSLLVSIVAAVGEVYEEVTPDNAAELGMYI